MIFLHFLGGTVIGSQTIFWYLLQDSFLAWPFGTLCWQEILNSSPFEWEQWEIWNNDGDLTKKCDLHQQTNLKLLNISWD
jgi:hypothetical protein